MIVRKTTSLEFNDRENTVRVSYDNDGDPYREGVAIEFRRENPSWTWIRVLLEEGEVRALRDKLSEFLGQLPEVQLPPSQAAPEPAQPDDFVDWTPVEGQIPPEGCQYEFQDGEDWSLWLEGEPLRASDIIDFKFRIPKR
jgi:hypothetical protein